MSDSDKKHINTASIYSLPSISVVIPTLNEECNVVKTVSGVRKIPGVEVIVVDGGSTDKTVSAARSCGVKVILSEPGRSRQMNAGAREARGEMLLFLHADTSLPEGFKCYILNIVSKQNTAAGAFRLRLDTEYQSLRIIERLANWRSTFLQMPYGDQAIFLKKELFWSIGGFRDTPIMEDFELIRQLKKKGRIVIAPVSVTSSARRWQRLGVLNTTLINQAIITAYCLGVAPSRVARWYRSIPSTN